MRSRLLNHPQKWTMRSGPSGDCTPASVRKVGESGGQLQPCRILGRPTAPVTGAAVLPSSGSRALLCLPHVWQQNVQAPASLCKPRCSKWLNAGEQRHLLAETSIERYLPPHFCLPDFTECHTKLYRRQKQKETPVISLYISVFKNTPLTIFTLIAQFFDDWGTLLASPYFLPCWEP